MKKPPPTKKQISQDWLAEFPALGILKPMFLARRMGPFVQGVCLDVDRWNERYLPYTLLHCLCRPSSSVSLTLAQPLLTTRTNYPDKISFRSHVERYKEAAERLGKCSLLPLVGPIIIDQVLDAYSTFRSLREPSSGYPFPLFEDAVLLLVWNDQGERALRLLEQQVGEMAGWPDFVLNKIGGLSTWREAMLEKVKNPEQVKATVEKQIVDLKVGSLPVGELLV